MIRNSLSSIMRIVLYLGMIAVVAVVLSACSGGEKDEIEMIPDGPLYGAVGFVTSVNFCTHTGGAVVRNYSFPEEAQADARMYCLRNYGGTCGTYSFTTPYKCGAVVKGQAFVGCDLFLGFGETIGQARSRAQNDCYGDGWPTCGVVASNCNER